MEKKEERDEKRKNFFMNLGVNGVVTLVLALGTTAGVWAQLRSDISEQKEKVVQLERREVEKQVAEREYRTEAKQDLRDVKSDVKDIKGDIQKILIELSRQGKNR